MDAEVFAVVDAIQVLEGATFKSEALNPIAQSLYPKALHTHAWGRFLPETLNLKR